MNEGCKYFQQSGLGNLVVRKTYGHDRIRYLRCHHCGQEFSERRGRALFNTKVTEEKAVSVINHLDEGCGLKSTARLAHVSNDTVRRLIRVTGKVSEQIHDKKVRNVRVRALQFDEKWSFIRKKQAHLTPLDDPMESGDHWDTVGMDPISKLILSLVPGKRTEKTIRQAVYDTAARLCKKGPRPAIFTDGENAYEQAILRAFGTAYPAPGKSQRSKAPATIYRVPADLIYAQVIKHRENGKVISVEIRPIWGKGKLDTIIAVLGWKKANTSAVERFNLTDRTRNSRKARKTLRFSKRPWYHDAMSWISILWYNFHHVHRTLGQTPAMAAGLADQPLSTLMLMRLNPGGMR
jgi:transposase-like protein/IS1 family transposase